MKCSVCHGSELAVVFASSTMPVQWRCDICCELRIRVVGSNSMKRESIEAALALLLEGMSVRAVRRISGISTNALNAILLRYGAMAIAIEDSREQLTPRRLQLDEMWSYVHGRSRNIRVLPNQSERGDMWVWTAIDPDTKVLAYWSIGRRTGESANRFIDGLRRRVAPNVEISTDGFNAYLEAIDASFIAARHRVAVGGFDHEHGVHTNNVEAHNGTLRAQVARFRRNGKMASKSVWSMLAHLGLYSLHYNYVRIHGSIRVTPMMEMGVTQSPWTFGGMLDACEAASADAMKTLDTRFMRQAASTPMRHVSRLRMDHSRDDPWRISRRWSPRAL